MAAIDLPDPYFAEETEATIRDRMLAAVDPALSTDEGDIVYDMVTPAAAEIDQVYDAIENSLDQCFAATATGTYLDALAHQFAEVTRAAGETDDALRTRLLARLAAPRGAGNVADFETWALESSTDIAFVYVQPLWSGDGTVRIFAGQPDRTAATAAMLTALDTYLAPRTPMGMTVTTAPITVVAVTITIDVEMQGGHAFDAVVQSRLHENIAAYMDTLGVGDKVIRAEIIAAAMATDGVYDVNTLRINGSTANEITVQAGELTVLGPVTSTGA